MPDNLTARLNLQANQFFTGLNQVDARIARTQANVNRLNNSLNRLGGAGGRGGAGGGPPFPPVPPVPPGGGGGGGRGGGGVDDQTRRVRRLNAAHNEAIASARALIGVYAGFQSVRAITNLIDEYTTLQNRLRLVTSSQQELLSVQSELFDIADRTRSSYASVATIYARTALSARALGRTQQELLRFTENLQLAATVSGASVRETNAGLIQLSQAIASNRLAGDEIRSVLENIPFVADVIARSLGVTRGELRELGSEGELTAEVITDAFDEYARAINNSFDETRATISQTWQQLRNRLQEYIGTSDEAVGTSRQLISALNFLKDNIDDVVVALTAFAALISFVVVGGLIRSAVLLLVGMVTQMAALASAITAATVAMHGFFAASVISGLTSLAGVIAKVTLAIGALTTAMFTNPLFLAGAAAVVGIGLLTAAVISFTGALNDNTTAIRNNRLDALSDLTGETNNYADARERANEAERNARQESNVLSPQLAEQSQQGPVNYVLSTFTRGYQPRVTRDPDTGEIRINPGGGGLGGGGGVFNAGVGQLIDDIGRTTAGVIAGEDVLSRTEFNRVQSELLRRIIQARARVLGEGGTGRDQNLSRDIARAQFLRGTTDPNYVTEQQESFPTSPDFADPRADPLNLGVGQDFGASRQGQTRRAIRASERVYGIEPAFREPIPRSESQRLINESNRPGAVLFRARNPQVAGVRTRDTLQIGAGATTLGGTILRTTGLRAQLSPTAAGAEIQSTFDYGPDLSGVRIINYPDGTRRRLDFRQTSQPLPGETAGLLAEPEPTAQDRLQQIQQQQRNFENLRRRFVNALASRTDQQYEALNNELRRIRSAYGYVEYNEQFGYENVYFSPLDAARGAGGIGGGTPILYDRDGFPVGSGFGNEYFRRVEDLRAGRSAYDSRFRARFNRPSFPNNPNLNRERQARAGLLPEQFDAALIAREESISGRFDADRISPQRRAGPRIFDAEFLERYQRYQTYLTTTTNIINSSLNPALNSFVTGTRTAGEALEDLGRAILSQIATQATSSFVSGAVSSVFSGLTGLRFGPDSIVPGAGFGPGVGGIPAAQGFSGVVRGRPGRDRNPFLFFLTAGEQVDITPENEVGRNENTPINLTVQNINSFDPQDDLDFLETPGATYRQENVVSRMNAYYRRGTRR